ncbi:MAG: hypothetical protein QY318_03525 [Candidatus Dojkabacteria bacterium]|nr:MAG: hypothetical protein QY318_03525 [Candidatus Dojkabacteria bacterium]
MRQSYTIYANNKKNVSEYELIFLRGNIGDGKSTVGQMISVIKELDGERTRVIRSDFLKKLIAVHLGYFSNIDTLTKGGDELEEIKSKVQHIPSKIVYKMMAHQAVFSLLSGYATVVDSTLLLPSELDTYLEEMRSMIHFLQRDFESISVYEMVSSLYPELREAIADDGTDYNTAIGGYLVESLIYQPFTKEDLIVKSLLSDADLDRAARQLENFVVVQPSRPDSAALKDIERRANAVSNLEFLATATPEIRKTYVKKKNADLSQRFDRVPAWVTVTNSSSLEDLYNTLSEIFSKTRSGMSDGVYVWRERWNAPHKNRAMAM